MTSCPTLMPFAVLFVFIVLFTLHHALHLLFDLLSISPHSIVSPMRAGVLSFSVMSLLVRCLVHNRCFINMSGWIFSHWEPSSQLCLLPLLQDGRKLVTRSLVAVLLSHMLSHLALTLLFSGRLSWSFMAFLRLT